MSAAKKPLRFQQVTIEFLVSGALDGETVAPPISLDPNEEGVGEDGQPLYVAPDERGIRVKEVEGNLGLIDPDLISGATQGDRCITWFYIDAGNQGGLLASAIAVVDNVEEDDIPTPTLQELVATTFGAPVFYRGRPFTVPQGSAIAVADYPAGEQKIVRLNIVAALSPEDEADVENACCCEGDLVDCEPPVIATFNPPELIQGTVQVTITGQFLGGDGVPTGGDFNNYDPCIWYLVSEDGSFSVKGDAAEPQISLDTAVVTFEIPDTAPTGSYTVIAMNPNDNTCIGVSTVDVVPGDCPAFGENDPDFQMVGTSDITTQFFGENFGTIADPALCEARIVQVAAPFTELTVNNLTVDLDDGTRFKINWDADGPPGPYNLIITPCDEECPEIVCPNCIGLFEA